MCCAKLEQNINNRTAMMKKIMLLSMGFALCLLPTARGDCTNTSHLVNEDERKACEQCTKQVHCHSCCYNAYSNAKKGAKGECRRSCPN